MKIVDWVIDHVIYCFNVFFMTIGAICLAIGLVALFYYLEPFCLLISQKHCYDGFLFILASSLLFAIGAFGLYGHQQTSQFYLKFYNYFLVIVLLVEIITSGHAFAQLIRSRVGDNIETQMGDQFKHYLTSNRSQKLINAIQHRYKCCGITSPEDYRTFFPNDKRKYIPSSCCAGGLIHCTIADQRSYVNGCYENAMEFMTAFTYLVAFAMLAIIVPTMAFAVLTSSASNQICLLAKDCREVSQSEVQYTAVAPTE